MKALHKTEDNKQFKYCWKLVASYLKNNPEIRNRQFRKLTGLGYDQAIYFFKRATTEKRLARIGTSSATHYVLPKR